MKKIYFTGDRGKGKYFIVDDEDYGVFSDMCWNLDITGYPKNPIGRIHVHTLIMNAPKGMVVDHVNRDKLDNRRENLRVTNQTVNLMNANKRATNKGKKCTSKHKGVYFNKWDKWCDKTGRKWVAQINIDKKRVTLGYYTTEDEAAKVYNKKAVEVYGSQIYLNIY